MNNKNNQFDPFATTTATTTTRTTTTDKADGAANGGKYNGKQKNPASSLSSPQPTALSQIQFRSALQVKQDAKLKAQKEKEQAVLLSASLQTPLSTQQEKFANDDNLDPFAHLPHMATHQIKKTTISSSHDNNKQPNNNDADKNEDDNNDDSDKPIPRPDDPVLYQAEQAALYAEELIKNQAAQQQQQQHHHQPLHQFLWNKAQGLLVSSSPFNKVSTPGENNANDTKERANATTPTTTRVPPQSAFHLTQNAMRQQASSSPSTTRNVTTTIQYNNVDIDKAFMPANTPPNTTTTTTTIIPNNNNYPPKHGDNRATRPTVVPVPQSAPQDVSCTDQSHIPWYARQQQQQPGNKDGSSSVAVPWYSRTPPDKDPPLDKDASLHNNKAPWYGDNPTSSSSSSSSSNHQDDKTKKGMSNVMGATALGGVVGLVALGPLAGVAAAGGLAYAATQKQGTAVGNLVRGAGSLVAVAVNTTSAAASTMRSRNNNNDNNTQEEKPTTSIREHYTRPII